MRRFLIAGNLDGQLECLAKLQILVQERRPDALLFAGSIRPGNAASHAEKLRTWEGFFEGVGKLDIFAALVPGAADVPLRDFLRLALHAEVKYPKLHAVHATLLEQNDVAICGLGGELTEAEDRSEDRLCNSRPAAEYYLRTLWQAEQPLKFLLLSVAPPGQLGGEAGNRICGEFIDSYHPSLCVVVGQTEKRGFQQTAHTLAINPGRLADGSLAWLDRSRIRNDQVELLRL
jgi:Icc-related predicted phosphoesterase